jgi:hypothetical protein
MDFNEALTTIRSTFSGDDKGDSISDSMWIELLDALNVASNHITFRAEPAVRKFLYYGCVQFDRWNVPTPFTVSPDSHEKFSSFLNSLMAVEPIGSVNLSIFHVHEQKTKLFDKHAYVSGRQSWSLPEPGTLREYIDCTRHLPEPIDIGMRTEFVKQRDELLNVIRAMEDDSLTTVFSTALPYPICTRDMRLTGTWRKLRFSVLLEPEFRSAEGFETEGDGITRPMGSTRWQAGRTKVAIHFTGLVDGNAWTPAMRAIEGNESPVSGWPSCYTICFALLYDISWQVRNQDDGIADLWPPSPRDISAIELYMLTPQDERLDYKMMQLGMWRTEVGQAGDRMDVDLGEVVLPAYWKRCRITAASYLSLGDTRESLIWLNIGVEALIDERICEMAEASGNPAALAIITGKKSVWLEAEQIVSRQFPEVAGRIRWPDTEVHQSKYTQIKLAHEHFRLRSSKNQANRNYSNISQDRNSLIHGSSVELVPVDRVLEAMGAFDWLAENFMTDQSIPAN